MVAPLLRIPALGLALAVLMIGATAGSRANAMADALQVLVGRRVSARVWGAAPPVGSGDVFVLESAFAITAGLHLRLRPATGGLAHRVKVAQPEGGTVEKMGAEVRRARYVSWDGQKLKGTVPGDPSALILESQ
jgi:hypothetical protein